MESRLLMPLVESGGGNEGDRGREGVSGVMSLKKYAKCNMYGRTDCKEVWTYRWTVGQIAKKTCDHILCMGRDNNWNLLFHYIVIICTV